MSIIERAAGLLGQRGNAPAPAPASPGRSEEERERIEATIRRVAASFEDGPPTIAQEAGAAEDAGPLTLMRSQRGAVNFAQLKEMGILTPDSGRSKIAEEYRLIKQPLLANAFGLAGVHPIPKGNLIMVTSSILGEGKSFTAINLAISMASELESTVLLVDADVTKSGVMRYLGLNAERGLLDVLRDPTIALSDVLIKTDIPKLTVLPPGKGSTRSTEFFASSAMRAFVKDIASRYHDRIIIFDTPPLLATSEANVLASYMGQIVFVLETERTPQDAVKEALGLIADCEHVGIVLNKVNAGKGSDGNFGYGNYGYGSYGEEAKD